MKLVQREVELLMKEINARRSVQIGQAQLVPSANKLSGLNSDPHVVNLDQQLCCSARRNQVLLERFARQSPGQGDDRSTMKGRKSVRAKEILEGGVKSLGAITWVIDIRRMIDGRNMRPIHAAIVDFEP